MAKTFHIVTEPWTDMPGVIYSRWTHSAVDPNLAKGKMNYERTTNYAGIFICGCGIIGIYSALNTEQKVLLDTKFTHDTINEKLSGTRIFLQD